jgi:pyruvate kinase
MTPDAPRFTKIVATLGPASATPDQIAALVEAGMDVARLNASHGDHDFFERSIAGVRAASAAAGRSVATLLDLRGPKIRVGRLAGGGPLVLREGERLTLTTDDVEGVAGRIPCTYEGLPRDVLQGDVVLLDDGLMELRVTAVPSTREVVCVVVAGGSLLPGKGINVPGRALSAAAYDAKDLDDLAAGLRLGVDYVALSFVRSGEDVAALRREIRRLGGNLPIIAKIEKPQALDALPAILEQSDGIMVARGDLGVEIPPERVPSVQKALIHEAGERALPVITATQMLESMVHNVRPTRAEASDVANAIFDGTDAVMLSAETASGRYPRKAVEMMARIAREAEGSPFYLPTRHREPGGDHAAVFAMAAAAARVAAQTAVRRIVVYTLSGNTARIMSKLHPRCSIVALCPDPAVCRRMALLHGVIPFQTSFSPTTDDMLRLGDLELLRRGLAQPGETVVVLGGTMQLAGATNMVQLRRLEAAA